MLKDSFQNYGHFQNYGYHLIPCYLNKWVQLCMHLYTPNTILSLYLCLFIHLYASCLHFLPCFCPYSIFYHVSVHILSSTMFLSIFYLLSCFCPYSIFYHVSVHILSSTMFLSIFYLLPCFCPVGIFTVFCLVSVLLQRFVV